MKKTYQIDGLGEVEVVRHEFSGSFSVWLNGSKLQRFAKYSFKYEGENGESRFVLIRGSVFQGYKVVIEETPHPFSTPLPWYCYVLSALPLFLSVTLGNMRLLADYGFYFVGGAIGGLIGGAFTGLSFGLTCMLEKWYFKVLAALLCIALSFLACWGVGNLIVSLSH